MGVHPGVSRRIARPQLLLYRRNDPDAPDLSDVLDRERLVLVGTHHLSTVHRTDLYVGHLRHVPDLPVVRALQAEVSKVSRRVEFTDVLNILYSNLKEQQYNLIYILTIIIFE